MFSVRHNHKTSDKEELQPEWHILIDTYHISSIENNMPHYILHIHDNSNYYHYVDYANDWLSLEILILQQAISQNGINIDWQ